MGSDGWKGACVSRRKALMIAGGALGLAAGAVAGVALPSLLGTGARDAACADGEAFLREQVKDSKICELKEALGRYQDYVQRVYKDHPWIRKTH